MPETVQTITVAPDDPAVFSFLVTRPDEAVREFLSSFVMVYFFPTN
jgi:hypothetical protein